MTVFDTVYNPLETKLLKNARAAGAIVVSGVEMFVRQAMAQYKILLLARVRQEPSRNR